VLLPGLPPELPPVVPLLGCPPDCPPLEEGWFEEGEALEELVDLLGGASGKEVEEVEGEGEAYCWCRMSRRGVTTAAAITAAATVRKKQILFQFAMLGRRVASCKEILAVYGEDLVQLLGWP